MAPVFREGPARIPHLHPHILPIKPETNSQQNNLNSNTNTVPVSVIPEPVLFSARSSTSSRSCSQGSSRASRSCSPGSSPTRPVHGTLPPVPSQLNPLANEFVPFTVCSSFPESDLDPVDDVDFVGDPRLVARGPDIESHFVEDMLWNKFYSSDVSAKPPPLCDCHDLPSGSCPQTKNALVERIVRGLQQTGLTPNMDGLREPLANPSFPVQVWRRLLHGYFDVHEITNGFEFGWDVSFTSVPNPKDAKWNLQGASLFQNDVQAYVDQELRFGALVGPFDQAELPFKVYCSPVNTVAKKNSEVRRTVVDCTQLDWGINSFIDAHLHRGKAWKLTLPNSNSIISLIQRARARYPGERIHIFKIDFSRWYRWFLLDPVASVFFAIRWKGKVFLDRALSFGNRAAALAAQRVIWAVVYLFRTRVPPFPGSFNTGVTCTCEFHCECGENLAEGYIDDFIGVSPESIAHIQFDSALELAHTLGLRLSNTPGHVSPPSTACECLGILYDTVDNTMRLPQDKVQEFLQMLEDWSAKSTATEHELAVLCGKLLYASNVIFAGRLFLNRCLATKRFAATLKKPTILTEDFFADVSWWQAAITFRNGVSFLVPRGEIHVTLDASSNGWKSGTPGLGGYNHSSHQFFSATPPPHLSELSISNLELLAHVVALHLWSQEWVNSQVVIHTDNQACWHLLRNGRSREDIRLRMSRWISMEQVKQNFRISSEWIQTAENSLADALSRAGDVEHMRLFHEHCRVLGGIPTECHVRPEMFEFSL